MINDMTTPLVSVVIATRNRSGEIVKALESVQAQDYPAIEIIVVNDASTDDTQVILEQKSNIILVHNIEQLRLQKSLNRGCKLAQGKYIARLDDHDYWVDKQKLSKQVALLEANPHLGVIGTAITLGKRTIINPLSDGDIRRQLLFRCPFSHVTIVMRRDLFEKVGGYDESLLYSEDWDLWLKIGQFSELANLSEITTIVKEEAGSLTDQFYISQWQQNQNMLRKYARLYPRRYSAFLYQMFVGMFFKVIKKDSRVHKLFIKIYNKFFCS